MVADHTAPGNGGIAAHSDMPVVSVDPRHVTGLVCSHKVYVEVTWSSLGLLKSMSYVDGRPDLTDVAPEVES